MSPDTGYTLVDGEETMAVEAAPTRRKFTREEYHRMAEVGILKPTDRVELIRGEIVTMSPQGPRHSAFIDNFTALLVPRLVGRARLSVQSGVALADDSEPEPDIKVLRLRDAVPYKERGPFGEDVLLLIEVAVTSLRYDRTTKLRLYAEAGIPEYWIVDCTAEAIEVHRRPEGGAYREVTRVTGLASTVSPQTFPDVALRLDEIFA
jgi:Uma2 family endonuclease